MCKSASVSFVGTRVWMQIYASKFLCLVCCVFMFIAAYSTSWTLIRTSPTICVVLSVCNFVWSVNLNKHVHSSPQFGCSTTESNINFTHRHSKSNWLLLPAPRRCGCFSLVDPLIRHNSESALRVESNHILSGILEMGDSHEALHCASLLRALWSK
jgi:hypothetical protein